MRSCSLITSMTQISYESVAEGNSAIPHYSRRCRCEEPAATVNLSDGEVLHFIADIAKLHADNI